MRNLTRAALSLSVALATVALAPGQAAAKCVESLGHPTIPGYMLIVDGTVVGQYAMDAQAPMPPTEEIVAIEVVCRDAVDGAGPRGARQAAVVVLTRSGTAAGLTARLQDLVEAQRRHFERTGTYAASLEALGFEAYNFATIEMVAVEAGWAATARTSGSEILCRVAVRGAARDARSGVVACSGGGEAAAPARGALRWIGGEPAR